MPLTPQRASLFTRPFQAGRQPYFWLPVLIIGMTIVALVIGGLVLHYVEHRLVAASGQNLTLAAAEIADKLDRLLFERHGDVLMMSRTFAVHMPNPPYLTEYLNWMKQAYAPIYMWLGVTDATGRIIAATDTGTLGKDRSEQDWFQAARDTRSVHVGDVALYEAVKGVEAVAFTAPIYNAAGQFLGVVTTRVGIPMLEEVLTQTIHAIETRDAFLGKIEYQFMRHNGNLFIDSDLWHKGNVNLKRLSLSSALRSESPDAGYVEEEHLRRHVPVVSGYAQTHGYGEFKGFQWTVLVRRDRADILGPVRTVLRNLGLAGAVIWGPMFAVLFWAIRRLRIEWVQTQQESARARAAEAAHRESEERTRMIIETALDAVIGIDANGLITEWNPQAETMFGWSRREVIGRPLTTTIIPPQHRDGHQRGLRRFLDTGEGPMLNKRFEITACHRDGHEFPIDLAIASARVGSTFTFSAFVRDVTNLKRAEQRLRVQHAATRVLADATSLKEAAPVILEAVCEPLGWDLGILWYVDRHTHVLRCLESWASAKVQDSGFEAASRQRTFTPGVGLPGRVWKSGEPAWIADILQDDNFPRVPFASEIGLHGASAFPILLGGEVQGVLEFFSRDIRQPDDHVMALIAAIGSQVGHLIERRELEERLRQSQKMEAIGRLAGGIAHDFNNLLTVIMGYGQVVLNRLTPGDPIREDIEEIRQAGNRAAGLTGQLLAFSRRQVVQPKLLDLNVVVKNLEKMLIRVIGEDVNLSVALASNVGMISMDPGQIEQVILNLAINARDAMPKGGHLTIEADNVDVTETPSRRHANVAPGPYVRLMVTDTGCGMDEYTQSHIWEPFFTTKEPGKGTGLGLSMVYGIVKQADGEVFVDSEAGLGTTITIYLPRVEHGAPIAEEPVYHGRMPPLGTETLLVVEDEPAIRALVRDTLARQGYTVLEARHGLEALITGAQYLGQIHLLITDVVMPQMSGSDVAKRLTADRPSLKVLYMSGYTDDAIVHHGASDATAFLQKPFAPDALVLKVREVLDAARKG
ncbi:MAG TPA: PAS domain S-box protein [Nitrospiraceae bacterium]|nr:PAS domain S-box protein [Nitrospiraceae bacterium]